MHCKEFARRQPRERGMDRREFIVGAGIGAAASFFPAAAQTEPSDIVIVSELPPLPPDLINDADKPPASYAEISAVGTAPPSTAEIGTAYDLLVQSPFGGTPVDIAQYFLAVGAGAYGQEYRPFAREWPVRANPMIMHFFSA